MALAKAQRWLPHQFQRKGRHDLPWRRRWLALRDSRRELDEHLRCLGSGFFDAL